MFVSFDDGRNWQSMDLNLPPVPVTDLKIAQGDLVAATQGRGFWIFDHLSIVRQAEAGLADEALHLFSPEPTEMLRSGGRGGANQGKNPSSGVVLTYYIAEEHDDALTIDIRDGSGNIVRSYSSEERDFERCIIGNMDQRIPFEVQYPKKEAGINQWVWNMRFDGLHCLDDVKLFAGFAGATVTPGRYSATVSVGGVDSSADFVLLSDPRSVASEDEYAFVAAKREEVTDLLNQLLDSLAAARKSRSQVQALMAEFPDDASLQEAGESAVDRLTAWENTVTQTQYGTYEDEDSMPPMLDVHIRHVLDVIDRAGAPVSEGSLQRLTDLDFQWQDRRSELRDIENTDLAAVNDWARDNGILHVTPPGEL
jgi:hypothetical protein